MHSKRPKLTVAPPDYFTFNERQADARATSLDIIEWDEPIEVKESTNSFALAAVRDAWLKSIKESNK